MCFFLITELPLCCISVTLRQSIQYKTNLIKADLVLLPGKSHGQKSLVGYSPWGRKEKDTTKRLNHHHQRQGISRKM